MLYIVATPIGNLRDISLRAIDTLKSVDLIACEDTRHTKILLDEHGVKTPRTSFFQHNRFVKGGYLLGLLKQGRDIALVSDAGMPGVLDPGYSLVNLALKNGVSVSVLPGANALLCALVLSGKPAHEFYFAGFLPKKKVARRNKLQQLSGLGCTLVFYESCHRILACLEDIGDIFGDREAVLCRELTKKFEEVLRANPKELTVLLRQNKIRGEFTVVI